MAIRRSNTPMQVTRGPAKGTKQGKQHVSQPKKIAKKTKRYRK